MARDQHGRPGWARWVGFSLHFRGAQIAMSLSIRPTRPFGHSDLPTPPSAPAAAPRLRRLASKEGRLAPPHLPPLPAAAPRASPDRNVLMYLRTGSAGPTQPAGPAAWAQASFARRSPSREVRNPSRVLQ